MTEFLDVKSSPFQDQKPGTSGLRQRVTVFQQQHYLENFVQSIFNSLPTKELTGATLVVAGDGRYYNKEAVSVIVRMAAANGVAKIITGIEYLMTTPCVSAVVRARRAYGAIILTASHNPGGPKGDFGIKYNTANGGPAPEGVTDAIFAASKKIDGYRIAKDTPKIDASKAGTTKFGKLEVEVVSGPVEYVKLMKTIFNFEAIQQLLKRPDFSMVYDAMHGSAGPFAHEVFVKELGVAVSTLVNAVPSLDFGGGHPDPNLTYAHDLVELMGLGGAGDSAGHSHGGAAKSAAEQKASPPEFGAAADGDADRNMILGNKFFVTPSDSVAIMAAYAKQAIPYFKDGLKGVARSMPTSAALDRVAAKLGVKCYEVPTGWKFFGNLMDAGQLSLCGEESFGTGSDHIREKDGIWAVLAWLSILAFLNKDPKKKLVTVKAIVEEFWQTYGRNYYSRFDYEEVDSGAAKKVMDGLLALQGKLNDEKNKGGAPKLGEYQIAVADEFSYTDPVDKSVSSRQGVRFIFADGSRIVFRLSGTGSVGATIRVYLEQYVNDPKRLQQDPQTALAALIKIALEISQMESLTGRKSPTVIT